MKYLVTGVGGQLGYELLLELEKRGLEAVGTDLLPEDVYREKTGCTFSYVNLDFSDPQAVKKVFAEVKPDFLLNPAAWTAVDAAEDPENRDKVYAANVTGVKNLAEACRDAGIPMLQISTDYVFNGLGTEPWDPDCREYEPLCWYGETKLQGELAVSSTLEKYFIVRIAWAFGKNGANFVKTMLKLAENHDRLRVVCDQIGTPTYMHDLARLLVDMSLTDRYGYYHATNEGGYISWYDFTREIFRQAQEKKIPAVSGSGAEVNYAGVEVTPVTTEEYGISKAKRPFNSRLDKSKLIRNGFEPLPDWKDALSRFLDGLK